MEPAVPPDVCGAEGCFLCALPSLVVADVGGEGEGEGEGEGVGEGEGDGLPPGADPSDGSCGVVAGVDLRERLDIENCGISSPNLNLSLAGGATEEGNLTLSGTWITGALVGAVWRSGMAWDCVFGAESAVGSLLILVVPVPWCLVEGCEVLLTTVAVE